ncbi:MAG: 30S ribosome-binding factor RbfA [Elusimicrobia bacterium]|nr:30S ribosome-binding factor RbfA [Elusimicrobiota bacterium]
MLSYKRSVRIAELIQKEIAKIMQELKNPEIGFVTITGVKLTDDLLDARAYYSVMGSQEEIEKTKAIITDSIQEIRHQLALRLNLRRTPTLIFSYDDTPEKAAHVFELLEKIKEEDSEPETKKSNSCPRIKKK